MGPLEFRKKFDQWKEQYLNPYCKDHCQTNCCDFSKSTIGLTPDEELRVFGSLDHLEVKPELFKFDGLCPQTQKQNSARFMAKGLVPAGIFLLASTSLTPSPLTSILFVNSQSRTGFWKTCSS